MKQLLIGLLMLGLTACQKQEPLSLATSDAGAEGVALDGLKTQRYSSSNQCFTIESNFHNKARVNAYFPFYFAVVESCVPLGHISRVDFYARMPAHGHGMNSMPDITPTNNEGEYEVRGSVLQMPGDWVATIEITYGKKLEVVEMALTL